MYEQSLVLSFGGSLAEDGLFKAAVAVIYRIRKADFTVFFHVSTFILLLHRTGGFYVTKRPCRAHFSGRITVASA